MSTAPRHQRTPERRFTRNARRRATALLSSLALMASMGFAVPAAVADGDDAAGVVGPSSPAFQTLDVTAEPTDPAPEQTEDAPSPAPETSAPVETLAPAGEPGDSAPSDVGGDAGSDDATPGDSQDSGASIDEPMTGQVDEFGPTSTDELAADNNLITPMAAGPDGGTYPYVHWQVKDTDGNLVSGATFQFQYRSRGGGGSWNDGSNANPLSDCTTGTCVGTSLDRDADGGEFLLEHRATPRTGQASGSNRITNNSRYRVRPVAAPAGYQWVSTSWRDENDAAYGWSGASQRRVLDFGTFTVRKTQNSLICEAGYVYGITASGQIRQVTPGSSSRTVQSVGIEPLTGSSFNGLGIGYGGDQVFAYARGGQGDGNSNSNVSIYQYNPATGQWTDTGHNVNSGAGGGTTVTFVAGGVNLDTGRYFLGGYTAAGNNRVFRLWEYNPVSNSSVYKGSINAPSTGNANGDLAFDANGNLFVIRGSGNTTTVYSVTAANLAAANGGTIPASVSNTVQNTTENVNGIAFDADGYGFLSNGSNAVRYEMPGWTGKTDWTSQLQLSNNNTSTDLASCGSPPTITLEKFVQGGRNADTDQFTLTVQQDTTIIGTATTTGTATGVQEERVGPLPTVRNVALTIRETAAGTTTLNDYMTSYRCYVDGVQRSEGSDVRVGTVTIPAGGQEVLCQFFNSPLKANVTVNKQVTDSLGENPEPGEGWAMNVSVAAASGSNVTVAPTVTTQETNAAGNASWELSFEDDDQSATVTVSETQQAGYDFHEGECVVTHLDGTTDTTVLTGPDSTTLAGVVPGDQVECFYVNKPSPGGLKITKVFDSTVPAGFGEIAFSGGYSCTLDNTTIASGTWTVTGDGEATVTPATDSPAPNALPVGAVCSATEALPTGSAGLPNDSYEWGTPTIGAPVTIAASSTDTITVTNTANRLYGDFQVTKVVPTDSTADSANQYSGTWQCVLDDETVSGTWGEIEAGGTWSSTTSQVNIPLGAECTVLTEKRPNQPVASDPSYSWDGDPQISAAVAAKTSELETVTVTNITKRELGTVTWTKVDEQDEALSGSEWAIAGTDPVVDGFSVTDCVADTEAGCEEHIDKDHRGGYFLVEDLAWGTYTLTEPGCACWVGVGGAP